MGSPGRPERLWTTLWLFSGATGGLSTEKAASPKLLSVRHANHTGRGTGLSALQVAVSIGEKAVVHKKGLALLLLLFIYKTLKEQPKNILGAKNRCRGCQNRGGDGKVLATEVGFGKTKAMFRRQLRPFANPLQAANQAKGAGVDGANRSSGPLACQNGGTGAMPGLKACERGAARPGQPIPQPGDRQGPWCCLSKALSRL